jgi:hypothetical protein
MAKQQSSVLVHTSTRRAHAGGKEPWPRAALKSQPWSKTLGCPRFPSSPTQPFPATPTTRASTRDIERPGRRGRERRERSRVRRRGNAYRVDLAQRFEALRPQLLGKSARGTQQQTSRPHSTYSHQPIMKAMTTVAKQCVPAPSSVRCGRGQCGSGRLGTTPHVPPALASSPFPKPAPAHHVTHLRSRRVLLLVPKAELGVQRVGRLHGT